MKTSYKIFFIALLSGMVGILPKAIGKANAEPLRYEVNKAFTFGEELNYNIGYKFIDAGTATFKVLDNPIYRQGNKAYDIRFNVNSLSSLEWIYKVNDKYRSVVDVYGVYPYEFQQILREGDFKRDFKATFDHKKQLAVAGKDTYAIKPFTHDIVSALYYVRTMDLKDYKKGDIIKLQNFYGDTTYSLGVKILGKQTIEVEAGKFRTVVIEPMVVEGGLFKSDGSIVVWLTDDERKIPVKVGTEIPIGFVGAELKSYSGIRGSIAAKLN
jgi:hypothetical protein